MSKLFQITADDLADLERTLPELADALTPNLDNALRIKIRRVQEIMSRIRWDYGPPKNLGVVPASSE